MTIEIRGLTKRYGATLALDNVDLTISSGEVHALLGHNGAGKSTLIKCLGGGTRPNSGTITLDGRELANLSPRSSIDAGISIIYQHLGLIESLTVSENIFLGAEMTTGPTLRRNKQLERSSEALRRIGATIDPRQHAGALSMGQRQQVAIAKALYRNASVLILDEPTAALSPIEAAALGDTVRQLQSQGIAILYVTHLLNEVETLADEVTILRNGKAVWTAPITSTTKRDLVVAISNGDHESSPPSPIDQGAPVRLTLPNLPLSQQPAASDDAVGGYDLEVRAGEIVALYGLIGSGRTRLLESVFGANGQARAARVHGTDVICTSPRSGLAAGMALIPADRYRQGLFQSLSAQENVVLRAMTSFGRGPFRSQRRERDVFHEVSQLLSLRPGIPSLQAARFSGGNQQKLLIGRWINAAVNLKVLLVDDPTQGVDVGARAEIYQVLRTLAAERGIAIVFSTNEPEEVLALAHRCVLMSRGHVTGVVDVADTTPESLLSLIHPMTPTFESKAA